MLTHGLELHSPCVQPWTIHKANSQANPPMFSHLASQIYWIGLATDNVLSSIDITPDAVDECIILTCSSFEFGKQFAYYK